MPQLPRLFGRLPKARFEIRLTDPAQWYPPPDDGTRPGIFAMPVVNPRTVSIFGLEALLTHEGMPGRHFDGGIKLESDIPDFRRRSRVNAAHRRRARPSKCCATWRGRDRRWAIKLVS